MERPEKALAYWRRIAKNPPADVDGNKLVNWIEELEGWIEETNKILLLPIPGDTNQSAASVIAHAKMALKGERSGLSDLATGATGKIRLRGEGT